MSNTERWTSQNGRWGLEVIDLPESRFPFRGTVERLGTLAGIKCLRAKPNETAGTWVLAVRAAVEAVMACSIVEQVSLQGGDAVSILIARPDAVWREWGYKGRSSYFLSLNKEGKVKELSPSVLLAAGLIEPDEAPEATQVAPPPPVGEGALADALRKAGIID